MMEHLELMDRIYLRLKKMIFNQELKPGQKLVQEKLAEDLGVSRSPLLKALQKLENELLVERIPRRGMYVKSMSLKEIVDIFQCRTVFEGLSARLTASLATPEQLKELKLLFTPFQNKKRINTTAYANADRIFHTRVMHYSGNAVVNRLEILSNIQLKAYQTGLIRPPQETLSEHFAIIDAMVKRDGLLAEKLMRQHIEKSLKAFKEKNNID